MKILSVLLLLMVVFLGYDLWYGHNGYLDYREVSAQLEKARELTDQQRQRNDMLRDEITELQQGNLALEELARSELGMVKPHETFYRIIEPRTAVPAAASQGAAAAQDAAAGRQP